MPSTPQHRCRKSQHIYHIYLTAAGGPAEEFFLCLFLFCWVGFFLFFVSLHDNRIHFVLITQRRHSVQNAKDDVRTVYVWHISQVSQMIVTANLGLCWQFSSPLTSQCPQSALPYGSQPCFSRQIIHACNSVWEVQYIHLLITKQAQTVSQMKILGGQRKLTRRCRLHSHAVRGYYAAAGGAAVSSPGTRR